jgi:uncharacterized protein involved in exopolysaccharide biosynthesis
MFTRSDNTKITSRQALTLKVLTPVIGMTFIFGLLLFFMVGLAAAAAQRLSRNRSDGKSPRG